mgnify:CR=1 FL=1|tara:strand:- start:2068 stop:3138 length:1071 start_codon:yes stop_codon:yes gene_type:complete
MNLKRQTVFWLSTFAVFAVVLFVLREVLLPFVAGMLVAYFLDPLVDRVERIGLSRTVATLAVTLTFFTIVILLFVAFLPTLQRQLVGLINQVPEVARWVEDSLASGGLQDTLLQVFGGQENDVRTAAQGLAGSAIVWLGSAASGIWSGGLAIFNLLSLVFITPVISFYLLRDYDRMVTRVDNWLPRHTADTIRQQIGLIDSALAGFLRGQASVCLILGIFYAVTLSLTGLNFGFAIGLIGGALAFIPYVGMILTLALSVGVAVVQFWPEPLPIILVVVIFLIGQLVEGTVLTPKLVGERVGLHPVWVIFALFSGAAIAGFLGVLIAVPVAAILGVLLRHFMSRYLDSRYYSGKGGT